MTKLDEAKNIQGKICNQVNGWDISIWSIKDIKILVKGLDSWLNADDKEEAADFLWDNFYISDKDFSPSALKTLFDLVTEFLTLGVDTADLEEVTMIVNPED